MKQGIKLVQGVGINDADYKTRVYENVGGRWKCTWTCPYYRRWSNMLKRCYSVKLHEAQPTYTGCTVCEEWLVFSRFKQWMENQDWEGNELDKDGVCKWEILTKEEMSEKVSILDTKNLGYIPEGRMNRDFCKHS